MSHKSLYRLAACICLLSTIIALVGPIGSTRAAEPITLKMTIWGSGSDPEIYQKRLDLFTAKNPDIKVEVVYIPSDYSQKVQTMIAGGTAPDIMEVAEDIHGYSGKG